MLNKASATSKESSSLNSNLLETLSELCVFLSSSLLVMIPVVALCTPLSGYWLLAMLVGSVVFYIIGDNLLDKARDE